LIKRLMQLDRAWKAVLPLALAYAVLGSLLLQYSPSFSGRLFITMPFIIIFCRVNERATPFFVSLPIPAHQIFLARILSILAALWIPTLFSSLIFSLQRPRGPMTAMLLIEATSLVTLMVLIMQSIRVQEMGVLPKYVLLLFLIPQTFLIWSVFEWPLLPMEFMLAACLIASALFFVYIWKRIPRSFQIARPQAAAIQPISTNANVREWTSPAWRPILRSVFTYQYIIALYLLMVLQSVFYLFWIIIFLPLLWINVRKHICGLGAFPIARRTILLFALMPMLLSLEVGHVKRTYLHDFIGDMSILPTQDWRQGYSEFYRGGMRNILPPLAFWKPVHSDKAPWIAAPWGETFQPPILEALGFKIYNPYAVGKDNSRRFFDWQFAIATNAVYGKTLPQSEIKSLWISRYDHRPILPTKFHIAYSSLNIGLVMILLSCIELFNLPCFHKFRKSIRIFGILVLISIVAAIVLFLIVVKIHISYYDALPLIISWALPDNLPAAIGIAVASLALLYWILDVLFRKAECGDKRKEASSLQIYLSSP
jgi:hypothetical protein